MQMSFIQGRQRLIQNGVPDSWVPLSGELEQRLEEERSGGANTGSGTNLATQD